MEQDITKVLITEEEIQAKVKELAAQISHDYEGKNPLFVGVLKGVVMFFSDLVRNVTVPCTIDFMCLSSYGHGTESSGNMKLKKDIDTDVHGRHVVILEDIFDTGNSLDFTYKYLLSKQPASVRICTFLDKPERRSPLITLQPDYTGYVVPNEFVVGYGLDYDEHYRNLPYIGILDPKVYNK